ncbi:MAG: hypothetical protein ACRD18_01800, partial [Terriglobia bacterium]
ATARFVCRGFLQAHGTQIVPWLPLQTNAFRNFPKPLISPALSLRERVAEGRVRGRFAVVEGLTHLRA